MTEKIEVAELSAEAAAGLAEFDQLTGATEAPAAPGAVPEQEPAAPAVDLAGELAGLLLTVSAVLKPALPSLEKIYTEEKCASAGAALAAVCNKRGWLQGGVVGGYGEELAALAVVGPMAIATYAGVKADMAAHKEKPAALADSTGTGPATPPELTPVNMLERG